MHQQCYVLAHFLSVGLSVTDEFLQSFSKGLRKINGRLDSGNKRSRFRRSYKSRPLQKV